MKFRKKPVVIEAVHLTIGAPLPEWLCKAVQDGSVRMEPFGDALVCHITTIEGVMTANTGDWIIRGIKGELYPCRADIFEATYEAAE